MGQLIDLRMVFEEKRIIDATVRVERCSTELLVKALGEWRGKPEPVQDSCQLIQLAQRREARR